MPERLSHLIRNADHAFTTEMRRALRRLGLTATEYQTLLVLSATDGMSGAQLSRACNVSPQTMASILAALATRGLVGRTRSSVHQQVLVSRMTPTGSDLLERAEVQVRGLEERALRGVSAEEQRIFVRLLRLLADQTRGAAADTG